MEIIFEVGKERKKVEVTGAEVIETQEANTKLEIESVDLKPISDFDGEDAKEKLESYGLELGINLKKNKQDR